MCNQTLRKSGRILWKDTSENYICTSKEFRLLTHDHKHNLTCFTFSIAKGISASTVTIQGEMVVAKFFAVNGPSGTYSHFWMSRAMKNLVLIMGCLQQENTRTEVVFVKTESCWTHTHLHTTHTQSKRKKRIFTAPVIHKSESKNMFMGLKKKKIICKVCVMW